MKELEYRRLESYLKERMTAGSIIHTKWCAISGAPCSGKTTVINELAKRGFYTNADIARIYIESEIEKGLNKVQVRANIKRFRRIIFLKMFENISALPIERMIFHDYALPDNIAFYKMDRIDMTEDMCETIKKYRYAKVFLFDPLPFWPDDARIEDDIYQDMIDKKMREVYKSLGYEVVQIPVMSVQNRINEIMKNI